MTKQAAILESIRDIIAGKETGEDDILELTQKVNDDGSVTELKPVATAKVEAEEPKTEFKPEPKVELPSFDKEPALVVKSNNKSGDILSEIDALLSDEKSGEPLEQTEEAQESIEIEFAEIKPQEKITEPLQEEQSFEPIKEQEATFEETPTQTIAHPYIPEEKIMSDNLVSEVSANNAKASISNLMSKITEKHKHEGPGFRSGDTVEDIVAEMLKPMMKDWLDANLPKLVNQIVEREIAKIMATS